VTSVASESAFSSGGLLLGPHHIRLHYTSVDAMMCARSWLQLDVKKESDICR
ncbi:Putative AC9 transposase, partial [Linum perenne]